MQPLHFQYEVKKAEVNQCTAKLSKAFKFLFDGPVNERIINELLINIQWQDIQPRNYKPFTFFQNINKMMEVIKRKYTNTNTFSRYIKML